jgi:hypothetical protein
MGMAVGKIFALARAISAMDLSMMIVETGSSMGSVAKTEGAAGCSGCGG